MGNLTRTDRAGGAVRVDFGARGSSRVRWGDPYWYLIVTVAGVVLALSAGIGVGGLGSHRLDRTADDVGQGVLSAIAAVAALRAALRASGRRRTAWVCMTIGLWLWTGGQALWCWYEIVRQQPAPFPSVADVGYLGFSVAATLAAIFFADGDRVVRRAVALLDGSMVASALLLLSWTTTLGRVTAGASDSLGSTAVSMAYPVADIVLLTAVVQLLAAHRAWRSWIGVFSVAVAALALADSGFAYASAVDSYSTGSPIDLGWLAGFAAIAVAAACAEVRGRPVTAGGRLGTEDSRSSMLPYAVIGSVAVVVVVLLAAGRRVDTTEAVMILVCSGLVLARQSLSVRDNRQLLRVLASREAELSHQAFHDGLTGLPNRTEFNQRVEDAIARRMGGGPEVAVVFCDLDDFKLVNDTLGHRTGDGLLVDVARRLEKILSAGDTLARLGGDEFAMLLESGVAPAEFGRRIIDVLRPPFLVGDRQIAVSASVGVALTKGLDRPTVNALLTNADLAMYSTKQSGKGAAALYRPSMHTSLSEDLAVRVALGQALDAGAIEVRYQPIVDPYTGAVVAVEALARWSVDGVAVRPDHFVDLAERMGVVGRLTDVMLAKATAQLAEWSSILGHTRLQMGVNISALEMSDPDLPGRVAAALSRHAVRSDQLTLEVTESALMRHSDTARIGAQLRGLGVHLALDDLGAGQSSLARLGSLPFDVLKMDRSLIESAGQSRTADAILEAVLGLADQLGLLVVAEGVETDEQYQALRSIGRPFLLQGYLAARPLAAGDVLPALLSGFPELVSSAPTAAPPLVH